MKMIKLVCPHCGATLSIENGIDSFYCQYCGGKILLTGQDKNTIDAKVKLKEFEHQERMRNSELSYQERAQKSKQEHELKKLASKTRAEKTHNLTNLLVLLPLFVLLFVIVFSSDKSFKNERLTHESNIERLYSIEEQIGKALDEKDYEKALFLTNQLYCSDNYSRTDEEAWDEKRENYIILIKNAQKQQKLTDPNTIFAPASSDDFIGKQYTEIVEYLKASGFTNISTQKAMEAASRNKPENTVEHVLIGEKTSFTTEDYFEKDTPIIVYYYSK